MNSCIYSSIVALGVAVSAIGTTTAQAANRFAVVCVHNKTTVPINFQVKWADVNRWDENKLSPGSSMWFSHKYDKQNENKSPRLLVRFDSDLKQNRQYQIEYKLERRAAAGQTCSEGKPYAFEFEPANRNFIDLKAL
jgi:hypothetical protein